MSIFLSPWLVIWKTGKPYDIWWYMSIYVLQEMESPQGRKSFPAFSGGHPVLPSNLWVGGVTPNCPGLVLVRHLRAKKLRRCDDRRRGKSTNRRNVMGFFFDKSTFPDCSTNLMWKTKATSEISIDFSCKHWELCAPCSHWWNSNVTDMWPFGHSEMMTSNGFRQ